MLRSDARSVSFGGLRSGTHGVLCTTELHTSGHVDGVAFAAHSSGRRNRAAVAVSFVSSFGHSVLFGTAVSAFRRSAHQNNVNSDSFNWTLLNLASHR